MHKVERRVEFAITVERSKFFALLFPAESEEDLLQILKERKGKYRKANHHCWALRLVKNGDPVCEKAKDDGEVGHPGKVLLEILKREQLAGGIIVSRIFGGVKLGVGGVSRAFRQAGEGVIAAYRSGLQ